MVDNDGDGFVDCNDFNCQTASVCSGPTESTDAACSDMVDNDGDGSVDCNDFDCAPTAVCSTPTESTDAACSDGVDNDDDGFVDCNDFDCQNTMACSAALESGDAECSDGLDNDDDGFVDCNDFNCQSAGVCSPGVGVGDVIISELMINPAGGVADANGEWIELKNVSSGVVNLENCLVSTQPTPPSFLTIPSFSLPPGEAVIVLRNGDSAVNGGLTADLVHPGMVLGNVSGVARIECNGALIDQVAYDGTWGALPVGASMQLDVFTVDPTANDSATPWCPSTALYDGANAGTPGTANSSCF
jgi:hypothetical protein